MDIIKSLPLLISAALAAAPTLPAPPQAPLGVTSDSNAFLASAGRNALNDVISASPLLSFHRDLVSIESISGSEGRAGSFVADFLESQNFTVIKQPVTTADWDEVRFNIFAFPSSHPHSNPLDEDHPGQGPEILLTSHIDTVPPFIPYSLHRDDDGDIRIAGRGTVDAKASVAAQIFAALDTLRDHPTAPLGLLFVVGEETGGDGMKAFSRSRLNPAPSAFHTIIFGEPTDLALVAGHKGMLGFEVVAHGHPAHSGYPWLGASAISAILPALARVDVLGDIPGGLPASEKYGRTTLNIGRIEGGVAANVVPAFARADVAVRLAAGSPDDARDIIRRAVRETTVRGDATVEVDFSRHLEAYPPQDLDVDVPGFNVSTVNYGTDVPNLEIHARADGPVKRYLYGPGSIHVAHGDREALTVRQLEDAVCGYKRLIRAALDRTRS